MSRVDGHFDGNSRSPMRKTGSLGLSKGIIVVDAGEMDRFKCMEGKIGYIENEDKSQTMIFATSMHRHATGRYQRCLEIRNGPKAGALPVS